ncbi:hypothetical protein K439DRAFT_1614850 [Ramaria rubella]|nr:hypothetical protein K439DRAFT_1614850 [Ramaria rubella]
MRTMVQLSLQTNPLHPSESNNDTTEASLPEDAPYIPDDARSPNDSYVALSIVALQEIIHQLIFNFAHTSNVHYRDLLIALGIGSLRGVCAQSNWNIFQRMHKEDIKKLCRNINPCLSHAKRMHERSNSGLWLYQDSINDAGGEDLLSEALREWSKDNLKTIQPGRPVRETQLSKIISKATHSGLQTIHTAGQISDIACIVISWSTNPAADPCSTAVVGTSNQNVDQSLSDLGWSEPRQIAATFQTHQRLQHQKQYIDKLTMIISNVTDIL